MPKTIKVGLVKYKDPNDGQYKSINAVSDHATADQLAAISARGTEVINSIPSDWTELNNEIESNNKEFGTEDFLPTNSGVITTQGVKFTPINRNQYNVDGTASVSNNAVYNILDASSGLPSWAVAGGSYLAKITGTGVKYQIYVYNPSLESLCSIQQADGLTKLTIPSTAVGIRVRLLVDAGAQISNKTITVELRKEYTAKELFDKAETDITAEETARQNADADNHADIVQNQTDTTDLRALVNQEDKKNYALVNVYQLWDKFKIIVNEYIQSDGTVVKNNSWVHCEIPVEAGATYYFAKPNPTTSIGIETGTAGYVCLIKTNDTYYDDSPTAHTNVSSIEIPSGVNRMIVSIYKVRLYDNEEYSVVKDASPTNTSANKWSPRYKNVIQEYNGSTYKISCVGDSLTEGSGGGGTSYPGVLAANNAKLEVTKFAFPSEDSFYIAYATGGMRLYADPFTIPASNIGNAAPTISIKTDAGGAFAMDHVADDNLCMIGGVLGKLKYENSVNKFQRLKPGEAIQLARREPIYQCFEMKHIGDITIIWAGTNDSAISSMTEAIFYHLDNIINLLPHKKYLVLGVMQNIKFSNIGNIMTYFRRHYGNHFVNIRQYLLDYGLADAGITPTAQDTTDISNGTIPTSLRSDETHLNADGYTVVGNYLYKLINENGWLDE